MGEELLKKFNNDNYKIINELIEVITDEKIDNVDSLEKYQESLFIINGEKMDENNKISYCINSIKSNPYISEGLDFMDIQNVMSMKQRLNDNISNEEKIILIIKLYSILEKEMMLPFEAYKLIVGGKL